LSLPNLPTEYVQLESRLQAILSSGAQYTSPEVGNDRQSVQMIDLDSDGENEVVAFFMMSRGVFRAYIFEYGIDGYFEAGFVEVQARRLYSASFPTYTADGQRAIALSWTYDETVNRGLTVDALRNGKTVSLLQTQHISHLFSDVDGNGVQELFTVTVDDVTGALRQRSFVMSGAGFEQVGESRMSASARSVMAMQTGVSISGEKLLFIDSLAHGGGYVTDVISVESDTENLSLSLDTFRQAAVFTCDIDGDGALDVPAHSAIAGKISWYTYSASAGFTQSGLTYHNAQDRFFLRWPEKWGDSVEIDRTVSGNTVFITFFVQASSADAEVRNALLTLYVFGGEDRRQDLQSYSGVQVLKAAGSSIYAYSLMPNDYPEFTVADSEVISAFEIIETNPGVEE